MRTPPPQPYLAASPQGEGVCLWLLRAGEGACARLLLAIGVTMPFVSDGAVAQNYPTKPIRFIVSTAPGGSPDILARIVGQKLSEQMGQQVVVDNRAGGSGIIGTELVARSAPDGYTLLLATSLNICALPVLKKKLPFDAERDFAAVTQIAWVANVVSIHPSIPATTVAELVQQAKSRSLNYASAGN